MNGWTGGPRGIAPLERRLAIVASGWWIAAALALVMLATVPTEAFAHGVATGDKGYIQSIFGVHLVPFAYLGAKHMVTGYDHLLFLLGVIFFLYRLKDVGLYVTLFAIGHSTTLLFGVLTGVSVSSYLIDAIIGLSVVYKALDNLGAFQRWFGFQPDTKAATLRTGVGGSRRSRRGLRPSGTSEVSTTTCPLSSSQELPPSALRMTPCLRVPATSRPGRVPPRTTPARPCPRAAHRRCRGFPRAVRPAGIRPGTGTGE